MTRVNVAEMRTVAGGKTKYYKCKRCGRIFSAKPGYLLINLHVIAFRHYGKGNIQTIYK